MHTCTSHGYIFMYVRVYMCMYVCTYVCVVLGKDKDLKMIMERVDHI